MDPQFRPLLEAASRPYAAAGATTDRKINPGPPAQRFMSLRFRATLPSRSVAQWCLCRRIGKFEGLFGPRPGEPGSLDAAALLGLQGLVATPLYTRPRLVAEPGFMSKQQRQPSESSAARLAGRSLWGLRSAPVPVGHECAVGHSVGGDAASRRRRAWRAPTKPAIPASTSVSDVGSGTAVAWGTVSSAKP